MPIKINGSTSGSTTITAPATGSDESIELSTALASKAATASPTFTGNVVLPATTQIGGGTDLGAWTSWTPTFTQTGALTTSSLVGRYVQIGKIVHAWFAATFSNAGTTNTNFLLTNLPVNAVSGLGFRIIGTAGLFDSSTNTAYAGDLVLISNTEVRFIGDWAGSGQWGAVPNLAIASGDNFRAVLTYQAD